jgi:hypothetical protein
MDKKIKYVTLDIATHLYQEDLNRLLDHLKKLDDFAFLIKSEVYTDARFRKNRTTNWNHLANLSPLGIVVQNVAISVMSTSFILPLADKEYSILGPCTSNTLGL